MERRPNVEGEEEEEGKKVRMRLTPP